MDRLERVDVGNVGVLLGQRALVGHLDLQSRSTSAMNLHWCFRGWNLPCGSCCCGRGTRLFVEYFKNISFLVKESKWTHQGLQKQQAFLSESLDRRTGEPAVAETSPKSLRRNAHSMLRNNGCACTKRCCSCISILHGCYAQPRVRPAAFEFLCHPLQDSRGQ